MAAETTAERPPPVGTEAHASGLAGHRALAHPLRLRIIRLLRTGPRSASALARELGVRPGSARFHLGVLERAGIVSRAGERVVNGGREVLFAAPEVVTLDDDVEPSVRWATDRAFLQELTHLVELGATEPGGVAGFSLHVWRFRDRDAKRAERIVRQATRALAELHRPDDPRARPHLAATQLIRLPDAAAPPA
jgi:DNA-binding transcriptional ArsR family regulator